MHALRPEILIGDSDSDQLPLALAADGVVRYVWQSAFGPMLIEVKDGIAFVNGDAVVPIGASEAPADPRDDPGPVRPVPSLSIVAE